MVCPKCRRIYPAGDEVCAEDGIKLVPEVGDFPTGVDDSPYDRATPTPPGTRPFVPAGSKLSKTPSHANAYAPSFETPTPIGREGSAPRSHTDSRTPVGREISSPRMVLQDIQISAGDLIADYQITGRLGEGGMGTVYAGIQPVIGKPVAIKVLLREFAANAEVVNRFIQEARAANQARSRYIVDIFSFGELNDGRHYFVMEHLDGQSLREVLTEKKVVGFDDANSILSSIAKGLVAAHDNGIIHRDIKPENIMVLTEEDGTVIAKILDFGIAKLQGSMANPDFATKTGAAMGTPFYMSPEQCRGVDVDHRTDIYALGIIMFEMFTGELPFKANSYIELVNKHLFASPPEMRALNPEISAQLEAFVQRCIAKNPDERPQSMKQFLLELKELVPSLHQTHPSAVNMVPMTGMPDGSDPGTAGVGVRSARGKSRAGLVLGLLAVVLLAGAGVGAYLMLRKDPGGDLIAGPGSGSGAVVKGPATTADAAVATEAVLKVDTDPPGATVHLGHREHPHRTPTTIKVPPGKIQLRVVLQGFVTIEEVATLEPGQTREVRYRLTSSKAKMGSLAIRTNVEHATFYLDGTIVGQGTQLALERVEARAHMLRITAPRHRSLEQAVTVSPGKQLALALTLQRQRRGHTTKQGTKNTKQGKTGTDDPDVTLNPFKKR